MGHRSHFRNWRRPDVPAKAVRRSAFEALGPSNVHRRRTYRLQLNRSGHNPRPAVAPRSFTPDNARVRRVYWFREIDFMAARALSMNSWAIGLSVLFFSVTTATGLISVRKSIGKALNKKRRALKRSTEPGRIPRKWPLAIRLQRRWVDSDTIRAHHRCEHFRP
jgi:hypothetical protein